MSNQNAIDELSFVFNALESKIEYHREEARKHNAIADVLFSISNEVDKRRGKLEDDDRKVEL